MKKLNRVSGCRSFLFRFLLFLNILTLLLLLYYAYHAKVVLYVVSNAEGQRLANHIQRENHLGSEILESSRNTKYTYTGRSHGLSDALGNIEIERDSGDEGFRSGEGYEKVEDKSPRQGYRVRGGDKIAENMKTDVNSDSYMYNNSQRITHQWKISNYKKLQTGIRPNIMTNIGTNLSQPRLGSKFQNIILPGGIVGYLYSDNRRKLRIKLLPPQSLFSEGPLALLAAKFYPAISIKQQMMFVDLLNTFIKVTRNVNVTFFAMHGTLLGVCRHGGMIPWDDDLDLMINNKDRLKICSALNQYDPDYACVQFAGRLKFFHRHESDPLPGFQFRYPNLDIFFYNYTYTPTHKQALTETIFPFRVFLYDDIFPLSYRYFWNFLIPVPGRPWNVLEKMYSDHKTCISLSYSHVSETVEQPYSIQCKQLSDILHYHLADYCRDP